MLKNVVSKNVNNENNQWLMETLEQTFITHNNKTKAAAFHATTDSTMMGNGTGANQTGLAKKQWKPLKHRKELIMGLIRAQAVQQQVIKKSTVQECFRGTGIFPFDADIIYDNAKCEVPLET